MEAREDTSLVTPVPENLAFVNERMLLYIADVCGRRKVGRWWWFGSRVGCFPWLFYSLLTIFVGVLRSISSGVVHIRSLPLLHLRFDKCKVGV